MHGVGALKLSMVITASRKPLVIRYRSPDKLYSSAAGEADMGLNAPFDEMRLEVGQSFETGDLEILSIAELDG